MKDETVKMLNEHLKKLEELDPENFKFRRVSESLTLNLK
jgi:hypothetical protein